jgi:deoxyribonucleoside regulator
VPDIVARNVVGLRKGAYPKGGEQNCRSVLWDAASQFGSRWGRRDRCNEPLGACSTLSGENYCFPGATSVSGQQTSQSIVPLESWETSEVRRHRSEQALQVSELYYLDNLSQKEVAKRLRLSKASVSRLLQFAREEGLVRISIHPPHNLALAREVLAFVKHYGVREVIVAGTKSAHVGQAAAAYFEQYARPRQTILLDGGFTVQDFVAALRGGLLTGLNVVPLCADPISYDVASCELMARFSTKYSGSKCFRVPRYRSDMLDGIREEIVRISRQADHVILGVGPWDPDFTALKFVEHLGLDPSELRQRETRIAAVCGYVFLDKESHCVAMPAIEERILRVLDLEDLRRLSGKEGCRSLLLAHSTEKRDAVITAIRARLCNTLIIDKDLAEALISARGLLG